MENKNIFRAIEDLDAVLFNLKHYRRTTTLEGEWYDSVNEAIKLTGRARELLEGISQ